MKIVVVGGSGLIGSKLQDPGDRGFEFLRSVAFERFRRPHG